MVIETRDLGFVEIAEADIIRFPHGLYGFEDARRFVLLGNTDGEPSPFLWLQSADSREPRFAVVDPRVFFGGYDPHLCEEDREAIGLTSDEYLRYVVIATVPRNVTGTSLNLRSPIVINSEANVAMQVILEDPAYPIRYYVFPQAGV